MAKNLLNSVLACGSVLKKSAVVRSKRKRFAGSSFYFERLEPRQMLAAIPVISEFMASNDGGLLDEDGASSDWIEIYNAGDAAVDLGGWSLTDNSLDLTKWSFPTTTLEANQSLLVFASGKDRSIAGDELHSNFKLSAGGEYLALVEGDGSTIAFDFGPAYPVQSEDVSYGLAMELAPAVLVDDTTLVRTLVPTDGLLGSTWNNLSFDDSSWDGGPSITAGVGYEASPTSDFSYSALINAPLTPLSTGLSSAYARFEFQLNSVSDINQLSLAMQFDDGFIAYLNGVEVASENAPASPAWNSLATGGTPDETATDPVNFDLTNHLDDLNAGSNVLAFQLLNRTAGSSDLLLIPELTATQSTVIDPFELGYFSTPTPGSPNGSTALGFTDAPTFSVPRGFYDTTFDVALTTETPGASLYYTTNGSEPTETNATLYTAPVTVSGTTTLRAVAIKNDFFPSASVTHTYLFAADIITQSSSPAGYPSDWGTHSNGGSPFLAVADYGIDTDVVGPGDLFNGAYTSSRFEDALTSIPTISLTMDIDDAFDGDTGFYANSISSGREWERETSVEWWDPSDDSQFQVNAGIRAHGGVSRQPWRTPKHGLRLYFRGDYGPGRLEFPLFGDEGVTSFDRLVFRSHYNDSWQAVSSALHNRGQFIQDPFVRNSFADMGNLSIRSRPANVYINGLYWGVYDLTERPDAEYFADHLGGSSDDYDVITARGSVQDGNSDAWDDLINFVRTTDLSTTAGYEAVQEKLDVENLVDYMLVNFFAGVEDWPHNNWVAANNRVDGGGFKFYVWDAEISMNQAGSNRTGVDDENSSAELYDRLRVNADFRQLFMDRALVHLSDGGALSPEATIERYSALGDLVKPALVAESARWGDVHPTVPLTVDNQWQSEFDWIINTYLPQRTNTFIGQLQNAGLASNLAAPEFATAPGQVSSGTNVSLINNQSGATLYYTLDGTDPRESGGALSGAAQIYTGPISIGSTTPISMRVLQGGDWSGIVSGSFEVTDVAATVIQRGVAYGGASSSIGEDTVDPTKSAYQFLPGTTTTRANYTSYTKGLNRVVIDLANSQGVNLNNADFEFRVGNTNDPANWTLVDGTGDIPLPAIISGIRDAFGVQRYTLAWPDLAIQNQWLQVTLKATSNTGLDTDDVFYLGNQIADVFGSTPAGENVRVNSFDLLEIKLNQGFNPNSAFDVDRSGSVDIVDLFVAKSNQTLANGLLMLAAPAASELVAVQTVSNQPSTLEPSAIQLSIEPPTAIEPPVALVTELTQVKAESLAAPEVEIETTQRTSALSVVRLTPVKTTGVGSTTNSRLAETKFTNESTSEPTHQFDTPREEKGTPNNATTRSPAFNIGALAWTGYLSFIKTASTAIERYEFTGIHSRAAFLAQQQFTVTAPVQRNEARLLATPMTPWVDLSLQIKDPATRKDSLVRELDELFAEDEFVPQLRQLDFTNAIYGA